MVIVISGAWGAAPAFARCIIAIDQFHSLVVLDLNFCFIEVTVGIINNYILYIFDSHLYCEI